MSTGYRAVLVVPEFRFVFAAHALSTLGTVVCELALAVLVFQRTASPLLSALTFALGLLPYVLGGTVLSAVADRFPARRVLVTCDLVCAGLAAGLLVPWMPVAALLALRCVVAAIAPVFAGTRAATLGDVLPGGALFSLGTSLLRVTNQTAQLTGFAVGGVLLAAIPPRAVLGVTVSTFLVSALLLAVGTPARPARSVDGGALLSASWSGARVLLADRRVRALLALAWVPPMFVVVSEGLLTSYVGALGASPAGLGPLMCGMPIGAIGGSLLAGTLLGHRARVRLCFPVVLAATLPPLGYLTHPGVAVALLCQIGVGAGIVYTFGVDAWFLDVVPEHLRGRAMTLLTAGSMTAQGLGMTLAGAAAEFAPVHAVIAGGAVIALPTVGLVVGYASRVRRVAPASAGFRPGG
ncbi:MFS transporter [Cryptosporangium japonicum]|uniref:MFS transporter n=1 Tax=Cryptosporangium japonicum TaxID=80872 RepID=A0ABN0UIJ2_9ACTN